MGGGVGGCDLDFKILNNGGGGWGGGGWKKIIFNGWVRHNGGVDIKMGGVGNPFQSDFGAPKDT